MAGVGALVLLGLFLREAFDFFIYLFIYLVTATERFQTKDH